MMIYKPSDIYPLTIVADRYNGCYSCGNYIAFNLYPEDIPKEVGGSDNEEIKFYANTSIIYGIGDTADSAIQDLFNKIQNDNQ